MKAAVHSVLFLCALCVLIWGGVSIAAQDKQAVGAKATAARTAVDAAKGLAEKVREANKDFTKNITDLDPLFADALKGVGTAVTNAGLITAGSPNKDDAVKNINDMRAKIIDAQTAVAKLKNAEAASLKAPKKAEIAQNLQAVEKEMKSAEDAANAMTGDYTSINKVAQQAEKLKKVAGDAVTLWTSVEKSVKSQKDAADTAVKKIDEAIMEVDKSSKYVGKNQDAKAAEAKNALETAVKVNLESSLRTAKDIQAASVEAQTNAQTLMGQYETVKTKAGELEKAARERKEPTGSSSFLTGPLLSITFPVFFLCLCVLPLQW